ncbi:MAG: hypothetical protein H0W83_03360 [Planctomycetes bacterium]|nr:hypothetical protein [Planctomycetota bacterium]
MRPDVKKETRAGWLVLAAAVLVSALIVWWFSQDDGSGNQLSVARAQHESMKGPELFTTVLDKQRSANDELRKTIEDLKGELNIQPDPIYTLPAVLPNGEHKSEFFTRQRYFTRDALRHLAESRSIPFNEDLGFSAGDETPPDKEAPFLLTMLQLTEKAARIAFSTPGAPITKFEISHGVETLTGPAGRPPLVREFPLKMEVTGTLQDVLWILHAFSQIKTSEPDKPKDFPLILQHLRIKGSNEKPKDQIQLVEATFDIAGMRYLSEEERGGKAGSRATGTSRGPAPGPQRPQDNTGARP